MFLENSFKFGIAPVLQQPSWTNNCLQALHTTQSLNSVLDIITKFWWSSVLQPITFNRQVIYICLRGQ